MNVLIPSHVEDSPAYRALRTEGVDAAEMRCVSPTDYGEMFSDAWERGSTFVIVEWDIIPWPGAVARLLKCTRPWCTHEYPLTHGHPVTTSFGINKFAPKGAAQPEWARAAWDALDGYVLPWARQTLGPSHVHTPPVAHAKVR